MAKNANGRGTIYVEHDDGWKLTATVDGNRITTVHRSKRAAETELHELRSSGSTVTKARVAGVGAARWIGQYFDADGKRRKVQGPTHKDVETRMRAKLDAAARGEPVGDGNATVADAIGQWRDGVFNRRREFVNMAPSTKNRYEWALNLVSAEFGSRRLARLTRRSIEAGFDQIASGLHGRPDKDGNARPLSDASMRHVRLLLVKVLDGAESDRLISANPARSAQVRAMVDDDGDGAPGALTADEAASLSAACPGVWLGNLYRTMMATGLRPGEAAALCWDAIDFDAGTLRVSRSVRMSGSTPELVPRLKNDSSRRTFTLPTSAVTALKDQRRKVNEAKIAATVWGNDDLVFPSGLGTLLSPSNVRRDLSKLSASVGIERAVTPHTLRHTAASHLVHAGVPLPQVARLLGHSTTRTLEKHYVHAVVDVIDVGAGVMDGVLGVSSAS